MPKVSAYIQISITRKFIAMVIISIFSIAMLSNSMVINTPQQIYLYKTISQKNTDTSDHQQQPCSHEENNASIGASNEDCLHEYTLVELIVFTAPQQLLQKYFSAALGINFSSLIAEPPDHL